MIARLTADRWLVCAWIVLAIGTCAPIWWVQYLPLLDLPNHLAAITVWHYHDDPRWDFARFYDLNLAPLPYWAHYFTVHLLTYLTRSVEIANRLFLTAYALAVPGGALVFARRFGRSPWLSLFTFPLVWNANFAEGFIACCAGLAMVPWVLVLVDRHLERPTAGRALAVLSCGSLIYFFHLLPYALFLVCAGLLVLARGPAAPQRLLARGLPVLLCTGIGLWALRHANGMHFHRLSGEGRQFVYDSLGETLRRFPGRLIDFIPSSIDECLLVVLLLAWFGLVVTRPRRADEPAAGTRWGVELCLLGALLLALLTPRSMLKPFYWYMINGRFVVMVALFGALLVRGPIGGWRRLWLLPVVLVTLVNLGALTRAFVGFNRDAAGFDEMVAKIPPKKQVLTLILRPMGDVHVNVSAFNQFPAYVQIHHGGYNFYNFSEGFPLVYRVRLPAPPWSRADLFTWADAPGWDYFLTFREGWQYSPMAAPLAEGKVRLVGQVGQWRLYQKLDYGPWSPARGPLD